MRKLSTALSGLCAGIVLAAGALPGFTATTALAAPVMLYASATGNGTDCTELLPCSLSGAKAKVRTLNTAMTADIIVYLRGGDYALESTLTFDSYDSGMNGHNVIYRSYAGEVPIISSASFASGTWALHDSTANIYKLTGITSEFRDLYVNGIRAIRARTPNRTSLDHFGPYYRTTSGDIVNKTYKINASEIAPWNHFDQAEMVAKVHWYNNHLRLSSYTTVSGAAYLAFPTYESDQAFNKKDFYYTRDPYYFENAYELLDAEGEWYLDTSADTLYYKPRFGENMTTAEVVAPKLEVLFELEGSSASRVHDIQFAGLMFRYAGWSRPGQGLVATQAVQPQPMNTATGYSKSSFPPALVRASYADRLRFADNTFKDTSANGLSLFESVKNSRIIGNTFQYIGANAIVMDGFGKRNPTTAEQMESNVVGNNTITRFGQDYTNGMGILAGFVRDTVIEHNDISYGPYTGMQVGNLSGATTRNNSVRYNHIHHVVQLHDDGGGIYTLGRQRGTHLFENYIHHIARDTWTMNNHVTAVYLDNNSEYITVEHNVIADMGTNTENVFEQTGIGAKNNTIVNNETQDQSVIDNAGIQSGYSEPPLNLANGLTYSSDSGWMNVGRLWDADSRTGEAVDPDTESWVEYNFGSTVSLGTFRFLEDNDGPEQATHWKVRYWNGSAYTDAFTYQSSDTNGWQEKTASVTTSKIRLYVKHASGGAPSALEFEALP